MHFSALPKAKLTLLRKIQQKKYRYEFQLYMAEGFRLVSEFLVTSPESIEFIIVEENSKYELKHDFVFHLSTTEIKEFAETQHSQGIIAVVKMPKVREIAEILQNAKLIVVCDAVQDPGNLGTIVRNALWFGADALILGEGTVDLYNPKTIRSCMSSLISISIRQLNLNSFFEIDLILAADVFTYLGDLNAIFDAAEKALSKNGLFIFTVEKTTEPNFILQPTVRYAHNKAYLESLMTANHFMALRIDNVILRMQKNVPVEGYLVVMKKVDMALASSS